MSTAPSLTEPCRARACGAGAAGRTGSLALPFGPVLAPAVIGVRACSRATRTSPTFPPGHRTDCILAVGGERRGFTGAAQVLSLYSLPIWRGLRALTMAKNLHGALLAGGITAMMLFQVFITVGIMPVTGIPLPLMSYGGSSVITTFLAIGLLQSIHAQGRASAAGRGRLLGFQP